MVQVKVDQLIRPNNFLGARGYLAVVGRQQLRADGGSQNCVQAVTQPAFLRISGRLLYHDADGALVQTRIGVVHAHVITAVGGKAQRQFAHIS